MPVYIKCDKCGNEQRSKIQFSSKEDLHINESEVSITTCRRCKSNIVVNSTTLYWKDA